MNGNQRRCGEPGSDPVMWRHARDGRTRSYGAAAQARQGGTARAGRKCSPNRSRGSEPVRRAVARSMRPRGTAQATSWPQARSPGTTAQVLLGAAVFVAVQDLEDASRVGLSCGAGRRQPGRSSGCGEPVLQVDTASQGGLRDTSSSLRGVPSGFAAVGMPAVAGAADHARQRVSASS